MWMGVWMDGRKEGEKKKKGVRFSHATNLWHLGIPFGYFKKKKKKKITDPPTARVLYSNKVPKYKYHRYIGTLGSTVRYPKKKVAFSYSFFFFLLFLEALKSRVSRVLVTVPTYCTIRYDTIQYR